MDSPTHTASCSSSEGEGDRETDPLAVKLLPNYGGSGEESEVPKTTTGENWEFAGHGDVIEYNNLIVDEEGFEKAKAAKYKHALGQLVSTAISGANRSVSESSDSPRIECDSCFSPLNA